MNFNKLEEEDVLDIPEKIPVHFKSIKGKINVPRDIILSINFFKSCITLNMQEKQNNVITVHHETTYEIVRAYFSFKWYQIGKADKNPIDTWTPDIFNDVIKLSTFFCDNLDEYFAEETEKYLNRCFTNGCTCGHMEEKENYDHPYNRYGIQYKSIVIVGECDNNCTKISPYGFYDQSPNAKSCTGYYLDKAGSIGVHIRYISACICNFSFWKNLNKFIVLNPMFAHWIWENIDRSILIKYIEVPKRRTNKLLSIKFSEIPQYMAICSKNNVKKGDPILINLQKEYDACNDPYSKAYNEKRATELELKIKEYRDGTINHTASALTDVKSTDIKLIKNE